jgi:hypothetical protein
MSGHDPSEDAVSEIDACFRPWELTGGWSGVLALQRRRSLRRVLVAELRMVVPTMVVEL